MPYQEAENTLSKSVRPSEVPSEIEGLHHQIEILQDTLIALYQRIEPVLSPEFPTETLTETLTEKREGPNTKVGMLIRDLTDRIESMRFYSEGIIRRIQL